MTNFWKLLKKPIIGLAPMDGVTDFPMRKIQCDIAKPDVVYTEFVSAEGFIRNPSAFENKLCFEKNQKPIVVQIFGYTPQAFYETIIQVSKLNFDGIDINMGCPAKSVLQKGGGGALIGNYKLTENIIKKSVEAVEYSKCKLPLSVKTRTGKTEVETEKWISFLSEFSFSEITIHGRLLKDEHSGDNNWEEITKANQILKNKNIVCLGNGGIKNINDAEQKCKKYGLDGVLIGKAALGNPWVFKKDYTASVDEILSAIENHAKIAEEFYGKDNFVIVRKHFGWYPKGFPNCIKLKTALLKTNNYREVKSILDKFREI